MLRRIEPARYYGSPDLGLASGIGLLSSVLGSDWLRESATVHPVEVTSHEDRYTLQADCLGMGQEDINVEISPDRVLTITGVRQSSSTIAAAAAKKPSAPPAAAANQAATAATASTADMPEGSSSSPLEGAGARAEEAAVPTSSFSSSSVTYRFGRSFALPDDANVDAVSALLDKGVLSVNIARRRQQPKPQPRRITVN